MSRAGVTRRYVTLVAAFVWLSMFSAGRAMAAPPQISSTAVTSVTATSVNLVGQVNPKGLATDYRFEYLTLAAYQANLGAQPARDPFAGAVVSANSRHGFRRSRNLS